MHDFWGLKERDSKGKEEIFGPFRQYPNNDWNQVIIVEPALPGLEAI